MNMQPTILDLDDDHCVGAYKTLFVQVWGKSSKMDALSDVSRYLADFARGTPKHLALVIVGADASTLDAATREQFDNLARQMLDQCVAVAFVYEGSALRAAATRSSLVAMTIARQAAQFRVCKSVDDALSWLTRTAPEAVHGTPYERAHAVRAIRQRYHSRKQTGVAKMVSA